MMALPALWAVAYAPAQADEQWPSEPVRRIATAAGQTDPRGVSPVGCLVFSPDSSILAYSARDLRLFDLDAGKEIRRLERRVWWPTAMAFCQGGERLVFIDRGKTVYFWKWKTDPEPTRFHEHPKESLFSLAVQENGDVIAVSDASNDKAYLWRKDREMVTLPANGPYPLNFVLDGKALLTAGTVSVSNEKGVRTRIGALIVFDLATGKESCHIQDRDYYSALDADVLIPTCAATSPDGRSVLLHAGKDVRFWSLADGRLQNEWSFPMNRPMDWVLLQNTRMALAPDGSRLAVSSDDKAVRLYDARTGKLLTRFQADQGRHIYSLAYAPNGRMLASGGEDGTILLWQLPPRQ
jgi:WD40 repeat protein